ncbi:MAG: DNA gyrase C-terminal beta-propeller domain-containing protein [Caldilineaceae bacterium]
MNLQPNESVSTMLIVPDFDQAEYITLITRQGRIKRMDLSVLSNIRTSGLIAMNLDPDDSLDWARLTDGNEEFMIVSRNGKALRFHEIMFGPWAEPPPASWPCVCSTTMRS